MELRILDTSYNLVAVLDDVESVLWHRKFNELGFCEIYVPCDSEYLEYLQKDYIITRPDDDMVCIINKRKITTDVEDNDYLVVTGYEASCILQRRITWSHVDFSGKVVELIAKLINDSIVNPKRAERAIPNFRIDTSNFSLFSDLINYASEEENIYTLVENLCKSYGYGFKTTLEDGVFTFHLLKQVDKSSKDGEYYVEFSAENQNILTTEYEEDNENLKNSMLVKGEENNLQIINGGSGLQRREAILNVTIPMTWKDDLDIEHTYTIEEYNNILLSLGKAELAKQNEEVSFSGTVDVLDSYIYRKDYTVGDIVKIQNNYGIAVQALVSEVLESEDNENGYEVEPVFEYVHSAPEFENSMLLTENTQVLMTEAAIALIAEHGISTSSARKISELPEASEMKDGDCLPIVQDGVTRKIYYNSLKDQLKGDKGDKGDTPTLMLREDGHLIAIYP